MTSMERELGQNREEAIRNAVRAAGSQSALARMIGTSQATVWKWLHRGLAVTPRLVLVIEARTGISRHDLRPDLYPREADDDHAAVNLEPTR